MFDKRYFLGDQEIDLHDIVFLKKSRTKKVRLDGKQFKIFFPRGKYKINRFRCYKNGQTIIGINPSVSRGSYPSVFDMDVRPVDLKFIKKGN